MDIDLSNTDQVIYSNGDEDGWIAKYDATGSLLWGFAIGGNANQAAKGLAIDEFNNIYVVGYFAEQSTLINHQAPVCLPVRVIGIHSF
ncbi:MAG: SBBP repeat-containing protein [Bacteroidetes bacterium]|nr:SBBP repeat-containing protein [Bacteroidota bacterium]